MGRVGVVPFGRWWSWRSWPAELADSDHPLVVRNDFFFRQGRLGLFFEFTPIELHVLEISFGEGTEPKLGRIRYGIGFLAIIEQFSQFFFGGLLGNRTLEVVDGEWNQLQLHLLFGLPKRIPVVFWRRRSNSDKKHVLHVLRREGRANFVEHLVHRDLLFSCHAIVNRVKLLGAQQVVGQVA